MMFAEFHFLRPYCLLALIPAVIILVLLIRKKLNQGNWSQVCDAELLPFVLQEKVEHRNHWTLSAGAVACFLAIVALAGPTWERLPSPVFRNDAALVIALDLSRSMDASDISPSRLSRARFKIADILKQRKDGQTALLVYAGDAFTVTPLTDDNETIASQLNALTTSIMPAQGSDAVLAMEKAVALLKQAGLQSGEILLMTDGVESEQIEGVLKSLSGYRLSILGIGTPEGAPIKALQGGFVKDGSGNIVVPKLNDKNLSELAAKGNGSYLRVSSDDSDINALTAQFDRPLEKESQENKDLLIEQWDEKGPWLMLIVLPLVAMQFRKGLLSLLLLAAVLPYPQPSYALEWKDLWQTQDQQAQKAFEQKDFQQAASQYQNKEWKAAAQYKSGQFDQVIETLADDNTAGGLYNRGNALAQTGKLEEALAAYNKSLEIDPANEDAKYNKDVVEKALEKQKQQQQNQQQGEDNQQLSDQGDNQGEGEQQENNDQQAENSEAKDSDQTKENQEQQNTDQNADSNPSESDAEQQQAAQAEQQEEQGDKKADAQQPAPQQEYDESEQANEQWLKRIPDDPAGLLRRKFKYQYGQRSGKRSNEQAW